MSAGLQLLKSIIENGAQTSFRQCHAAWFAETEQAHYTFVSGHLSRHGRLPSMDTMVESGYALPRATELPGHYMDIVRRRSIFLQARTLTPALLKALEGRDAEEVVASARHLVAAMQSVNPTGDITTLGDEVRGVMQKYEEAARTFSLLGTTLGWECINAVTDGAHPGDLIVLVGRPNVGKTYGMMWMLRQAWLSGKSILMATMEMSSEQIARRMLGMQSGVNPSFIRSGRMSSWSRDLVLDTISGIDDLPPFHIIRGDFRKNTGDIDRALQEFQSDMGVIDGGYLVSPLKPRGTKGSRREAISDTMEELKGVAVNRRRPIMTTVQFNREVKRKQRGVALDLSQIGETDVIAQIATLVLGMLWGEGAKEHTHRRWELLKNREGPLFRFETKFGFNPIDLSFTRMLTDDEDEDGDGEAPVDVGHMM